MNFVSYRKIFLAVILITILFVMLGCSSDTTIELSIEELRERIKGAWAGKIIGVVAGTPFEFRYCGEIYEGPVDHDLPTTIALRQDDLYVNMTFLEVLEDVGLDATMQDFAQRFRDTQYGLYHANLAARRNLLMGIPAPKSGRPPWNMHADDIDFQIEADFIGLVCPGMPQSASEIAFRVGPIMNYGDGVYGGVFVANLYSLAFLEEDRVSLVERALLSLPPQSLYRKCIETVLENYRNDPTDWRACWKDVQKKWDRFDKCPGGMGSPFNIDAKINGAYVVMGILYGKMDPRKTVEISIRCGQDADCNPSTALGILAAMKGYSWLPSEWRSEVESLRDQKFSHVRYTFDSVVDTTMKLARHMIKDQGGKVNDGTVRITAQSPSAPQTCEQWTNEIIPVMEIPSPHKKWQWSGKWGVSKLRGSYAYVSKEPGAEGVVKFDGEGVMIKGFLLEKGGRLDVQLDDNPSSNLVETYLFARGNMPSVYPGESLWYSGIIPSGLHQLRVQLRRDTHPDSQGRYAAITSVVVFRRPTPSMFKTSR